MTTPMDRLNPTVQLPFDEAALRSPDIAERVRYFRSLIFSIKQSVENIVEAVRMHDDIIKACALCWTNANPTDPLTTFLKTIPGFWPVLPTTSELTISGGEITLALAPARFRSHKVDTQNNAATDDLDTINNGRAGELLMLMATDSARTIVAKDGSGLVLGSDFFMDNMADRLLIVCTQAGVWHEIARIDGGA